MVFGVAGRLSKESNTIESSLADRGSPFRTIWQKMWIVRTY
jgi:hypothetical protein